MTKELFEKYKDIKSPNGWTIARSINTGVCYPSSFVGCHAGDLESYEIFTDLFKPVINSKIIKIKYLRYLLIFIKLIEYHKGFNPYTDKHVTDIDVNKIIIDFTE